MSMPQLLLAQAAGSAVAEQSKHHTLNVCCLGIFQQLLPVIFAGCAGVLA
jgi:hypothetical protein